MLQEVAHWAREEERERGVERAAYCANIGTDKGTGKAKHTRRTTLLRFAQLLAKSTCELQAKNCRLLFLHIVAKTTCELQAKKCINITATAFSLYGG